MATLSQLHLARAAAAAKLHLPSATPHFTASPWRGVSIPGGIPNLRITKPISIRNVGMRSSKEFQFQGDDTTVEPMESDGLRGLSFPGVGILGAMGVFLQGFLPAHALIKDEVEEMMRFSPEAWVNIYITTGIWLVLYFLVIPLFVYNYLRLRWYKRSFLETYFQFMLVFVFFPGMLLLAPFINFRRLPKDGAEEP